MSRQASQLIEACDALPTEEKAASTAGFLRGAIHLGDDETARFGDHLFRRLNTEQEDDVAPQ